MRAQTYRSHVASVWRRLRPELARLFGCVVAATIFVVIFWPNQIVGMAAETLMTVTTSVNSWLDLPEPYYIPADFLIVFAIATICMRVAWAFAPVLTASWKRYVRGGDETVEPGEQAPSAQNGAAKLRARANNLRHTGRVGFEGQHEIVVDGRRAPVSVLEHEESKQQQHSDHREKTSPGI